MIYVNVYCVISARMPLSLFFLFEIFFLIQERYRTRGHEVTLVKIVELEDMR